MSAQTYKRLPGRSRQFLFHSTLWEGSDHILLVHTHGITESYRRFFYRDIQAVVICQTRSGLTMTIVLGILAVISGVPAFFVPLEGAVALGVIAALFIFLAAVNHLRGPTCLCTIRTAVQTQELPSLNRMRIARKVLERLRPVIAAAQRDVAPA